MEQRTCRSSCIANVAGICTVPQCEGVIVPFGSALGLDKKAAADEYAFMRKFFSSDSLIGENYDLIYPSGEKKTNDQMHKNEFLFEKQKPAKEEIDHAASDRSLIADPFPMDEKEPDRKNPIEDFLGAAAVCSDRQKKILECSSRGDRRFSAFYARITINGKTDSIEHFYQKSKRRRDGKKAEKGKLFDFFICPFSGLEFPASDISDFYKGLWTTYFSRNPELVAIAEMYDEFSDMFRGKDTKNCQADVIRDYVKNREVFISEVKSSRWYVAVQKYFAGKKESEKNKTVVPTKEQDIRYAKSLLDEVSEMIQSGVVSAQDLADSLGILAHSLNQSLPERS